MDKAKKPSTHCPKSSQEVSVVRYVYRMGMTNFRSAPDKKR